MIIIPRGKQVKTDLNTYYLDMAKLIEHCQGELGTGSIYLKSPFAEGLIFFEEDTIINVFFQDYFPSNSTYRAHINIHYSTGIPVSSPFTDRYDSYRRMPSYKRVDIGLTKVFKNKYSAIKDGFISFFDEIIAGVEVFNLLDIRNTISYNWLTTVNNLSGESRQYAVPNYLTGRSYNLRLLVSF